MRRASSGLLSNTIRSAGRGWAKTREAFILSRFNEKGWRCFRSTSDPCLFVIDRAVTEEGVKAMELERSAISGQPGYLVIRRVPGSIVPDPF